MQIYANIIFAASAKLSPPNLQVKHVARTMKWIWFDHPNCSDLTSQSLLLKIMTMVAKSSNEQPCRPLSWESYVRRMGQIHQNPCVWFKTEGYHTGHTNFLTPVFKHIQKTFSLVTLWQTNITIKNHHLKWVNHLFLWPLSMSLYVKFS